jgi:NADH-quinone oxidoreductase subunit C
MPPDDLAERLSSRFADVTSARGEATLIAGRRELARILEELRADPDLSFGLLSSITATDWPGRSPRFWVAYHLYSLEHAHRVRVSVGVPEEDAVLPSITARYPAANWYEREVFDLFGLRFDGHPSLTRILMPDDWPGHPLRKDYSLGGVGTRYRGAFIPPVDERQD